MSQPPLTNHRKRTGMCEINPGIAWAAQSPTSTCTRTPPVPQWPYCEKRCSYCNFNKYIPRGVEEGALQNCLVTEARTLLRLSGVQRSVFGPVDASRRGLGREVPWGFSSFYGAILFLQGGVCVLWWGNPESGQSSHCGCCPGGRGTGSPFACRFGSHIGG